MKYFTYLFPLILSMQTFSRQTQRLFRPSFHKCCKCREKIEMKSRSTSCLLSCNPQSVPCTFTFHKMQMLNELRFFVSNFFRTIFPRKNRWPQWCEEKCELSTIAKKWIRNRQNSKMTNYYRRINIRYHNEDERLLPYRHRVQFFFFFYAKSCLFTLNAPKINYLHK